MGQCTGLWLWKLRLFLQLYTEEENFFPQHTWSSHPNSNWGHYHQNNLRSNDALLSQWLWLPRTTLGLSTFQPECLLVCFQSRDMDSFMHVSCSLAILMVSWISFRVTFETRSPHTTLYWLRLWSLTLLYFKAEIWHYCTSSQRSDTIVLQARDFPKTTMQCSLPSQIPTYSYDTNVYITTTISTGAHPKQAFHTLPPITVCVPVCLQFTNEHTWGLQYTVHTYISCLQMSAYRIKYQRFRVSLAGPTLILFFWF